MSAVFMLSSLNALSLLLMIIFKLWISLFKSSHSEQTAGDGIIMTTDCFDFLKILQLSSGVKFHSTAKDLVPSV